ncbi:MAG: hypothetical protein II844_00490 [Prevotella sp.]|nr:hypothetical protein [Prevotella sp.]MBR6191941.1 hypothetical protein [Prevotella sp.]
MDFGNILGGLLGGGKKTTGANETGGGLQDIIANLGLGAISNINPQDIISKFQKGEISIDQAQTILKQLSGTLGLGDKINDYMKMLKK